MYIFMTSRLSGIKLMFQKEKMAHILYKIDLARRGYDYWCVSKGGPNAVGGAEPKGHDGDI